MELHAWKALLLQWVQKCNFIDNVTCLENCNIEEFFDFYTQYAQVELPKCSSASNFKFPVRPLPAFLKEIYPNFKLLVKDDGRVEPSDYVYVYTLLLHYTCVQNPSEYFHNICKNLSDNIQQCIATFFQQTVKNPEMSRSYLHHTIVGIRDVLQINSDRLDSFNHSNHIINHNMFDKNNSLLLSNSNDSSIDNNVTTSTNSTNPTLVLQELTHLIDVTEIQAPSTPKTELLEQRTRELLGLRAQLETERYEKAVLEEQISENEHVINSLSRENKTKKKQLAILSASLDTHDDIYNDEDIYMPNEFDNLKKQLLKEINKRDADLAENKEEILELKSKHEKIAAKLTVSEKQLIACMDEINQRDLRLENVTRLLADQNEHISRLQRDKLELQQCLQEARSELHNGREVLNASSDLLETLQSPGNTNITPENLACSVIDKQLRETQQENDNLREQLEAKVEENSDMLQKLLTIIQPYQLDMSDAPDDFKIVYIIRRTLKHLSFRYEQEKQRVTELQDQYKTLHHFLSKNKQNEEHFSDQLKQKANLLGGEFQQSQRQRQLERKDEKFAQMGCELIQLCSKNRILEKRISEETKYEFIHYQELAEQQFLILSQKNKIVQQDKLNVAQQQLQNYIKTISAKFNEEIDFLPIGEGTLEQLKNMIIFLLEKMRNHVTNMEAELLKKTGDLTEVESIAMEILVTLNAYIKKLIADLRRENLPRKLKLLKIKFSEFVSKYDQLNDKCESIDNDLVESVENIRHNNEMLQKDHERSTLKLTNKIKQLVQQLEVERHSFNKNRLEKLHIEQDLEATKEKQLQLIQELKAQAEVIKNTESTSNALQEQIIVQTQQLKKGKWEISKLQQKLEVVQHQMKNALQQLHKEESHVNRVNEQKKLPEFERRTNFSLEQEQVQQIEQQLIIEKELKALQDLLAKREDELNESKTQLAEQQALLYETKHEITKAKHRQNDQAELITAIQYQKESLQLELRKTKERANRLENQQASLEQQRVLLDAERDATHEQLKKVERELKKASSTIRELRLQVKMVENEKVNLVLEVGGLNAEIAQQQKHTADLTAQLLQVKEKMWPFATIKENNLFRAKCENIQETIQRKQGDMVDKLEFDRNSKASDSQHENKLNTSNDELKRCNKEFIDTDKLYESLENHNLSQLHKLLGICKQQQVETHQRDLDCQILQAKYREAKEEMGRCEQKLKDQRLEMEGKLEKMKIKMRTLYTAEVTRIKEKQERDAVNNRVEMEKLSLQITKYQEHTRQLSNQIVRLNEKLLEQQKQNVILSTKLQNLLKTDQTSTDHVSVSGENWQPFKRPCAKLGSNLAMEDEEGEVFNNTYLTDLKLGTAPNMTAEELQYRNSLQPPHLKSTYAAQYDLNTQDDDIKDSPLNLDDSMSALLSCSEVNSVVTRKKCMGTHYKRPGPPTPSKNGGRLSFGSSEPPREILRESCDNTSTVKTPTRFKIFASRFSIGTGSVGGGGHCLPRDEKRRQRKLNLLNSMHSRTLYLDAEFCNTTPCKSRSYYDQHKLIEQCDAAIDVHKEQNQEDTPHLTNAARLIMNNVQRGRRSLCRSRLIMTSLSGSSSQHKRINTSHLSFSAHCRSRQPTSISTTVQKAFKRMQQQIKIKEQRLESFDRSRQLFNIDRDTLQKERVGILQHENTIYALDIRNKNYFDSLMVMGVTMLLNKQTRDALTIKYKSTLNNNADLVNGDQVAIKTFYSHRKQEQFFKEDNAHAWFIEGASTSPSGNEVSNDFQFKEICRQTDSSSLFEQHPIQYSCCLVQIDKKVECENNITETTSKVFCNANRSSLHCGNTDSLSHIRTHRLPEINVITINKFRDFNLTNRRHCNVLLTLVRGMGFKKFLGLGIVFLIFFIPLSCFATTLTVGLLLLFTFCVYRKKSKEKMHDNQMAAGRDIRLKH